MKLGFYYHIPLYKSVDGLKIPAYLGVFLDSLAGAVEQLILFLHEARSFELLQCDYKLEAKNISFISLGPKTPAWYRFLWPSKSLNKIMKDVVKCDVLIVRAPSPLAPAFYKCFHRKTKVAYFIVGDYIEGSKYLNQPWWRKLPIMVLTIINDRQLSTALKRSRTLVNSQKLYDKYSQFVRDLHLVRTTTLSNNDFFYREDTCCGDEIKLLYTGSFGFAKGLRELVDAFACLVRKRENITLHFAGWDYDTAKPVEKYLVNQADKLGVLDKIFFHGFKTVGTELNEMYRIADIYVIPSYHEGFPRTIWEAMANSMPVIATNVGSIPYFLNDMHNALLIEPQNTAQIVEAVNRVIEDTNLRRKLIQNGYKLAGENTLEVHTAVVINLLRN